jgi:flagellar motility protein MotE (MotC chaperone)
MAQMLIQTPAFYGKGTDAQTGLSPEDYISRLDDLQRTNNWTDAEAAGHATSYLNGAARAWFYKVLWGEDEDEFDRAAGSYDAFKALFKPHYFTVTSTYDLSSDWHNLKQEGSETISQFYERVFGAISEWQRLFTRWDAPRKQVALNDVTAAITTVVNNGNAGLGADDGPRITAAHTNALATANTRAYMAVSDGCFREIAADLTFKVIANGVKHDKIRELVRRRHKARDTTLPALLQQMKDLENTIKAGREAPVSNRPVFPNLKMGGAKVAPVAEDAASDSAFAAAATLADVSADELVAAVNNLRKQSAAGGGGKKNDKSKSKKSSAAASVADPASSSSSRRNDNSGRGRAPDYFQKLCGWCEGWGHLEAECGRKTKGKLRGCAKGWPTPPPGTHATTTVGAVSEAASPATSSAGNARRW